MASPNNSKSVQIQLWNKNLLKDKTIKSQVEKTWIQLRTIDLPGVGEYSFKAGNKEYHLAPVEPNAEVEETSVQAKKSYKVISELNLHRKYG